MPALVSAPRKLLSVRGSACAGAATVTSVATPTKVTVRFRFALFTGTTLVHSSHIDNTVRSPFAHYACPMWWRPVSRGSGEHLRAGHSCAERFADLHTRGQSRNARKVCSRFLVRPAMPVVLDHLAVDPRSREGARYRGQLPRHDPGGAQREPGGPARAVPRRPQAGVEAGAGGHRRRAGQGPRDPGAAVRGGGHGVPPGGRLRG